MLIFVLISDNPPRSAMLSAGCQCLKYCSFKNERKCCCCCSSKRGRVVILMRSVQIFPQAALFANAKMVYVGKFRVQKYGHCETPRNHRYSYFSKKTRFLREQSTLDYLSTQTLSTDKK